ncbi:TPA: DUF3313 domain-containing protein [Klebsiella pneumoniae]
MPTYINSLLLAVVVPTIILTGCADTPPVRYANIDSSSQLIPNTDDKSNHISYRYTSPVDWNKYTNIIIDPVVVYQGIDHQFGALLPEERKSLADYMYNKFSESLHQHFQEVSTPIAGTIRLKLTLTGADTTTPFIGTITKLDPLIGGPYNIVQSIRGKEGLFNGSVNYAVELYDASNQSLLNAYVAKQYPNAMNIGASIGSLNAAEVGIDKGAEELAEMLK